MRHCSSCLQLGPRERLRVMPRKAVFGDLSLSRKGRCSTAARPEHSRSQFPAKPNRYPYTADIQSSRNTNSGFAPGLGSSRSRITRSTMSGGTRTSSARLQLFSELRIGGCPASTKTAYYTEGSPMDVKEPMRGCRELLRPFRVLPKPGSPACL